MPKLSEVLRRRIESWTHNLPGLARETGIDYAVLYRFLHGKRFILSDTADRLLSYFNLEVKLTTHSQEQPDTQKGQVSVLPNPDVKTTVQDKPTSSRVVSRKKKKDLGKPAAVATPRKKEQRTKAVRAKCYDCGIRRVLNNVTKRCSACEQGETKIAASAAKV